MIGILSQDPKAVLLGDQEEDEVAEIEGLFKLGNDSRASKDCEKAELARDKLIELGIIWEDGPQGTTWRRK